MNIAAISYSFPHDSRPYNGIFVRNTLTAIAELGAKIVVISPQRRLIDKKMPFFSIHGSLEIYRPSFFSFAAGRSASFNTYRFTQYFFEKAAQTALSKTGFIPDVIYSHFLLPSGKAALEIAKRYKAKSLCVLGESDLKIHESRYSKDKLETFYRQFDILITNSTATKNILVAQYNQPQEKITAIANAVDRTLFFPKDKVESRTKLGFPIGEKIVVFVGSLIHRKGPLRVLEACRYLSPSPWMIFIGSGHQAIIDPKVLYCGTVPNEMLVEYLNAADVFVLPTLKEGMPNAVLEAMACSLPIVTSRIEPNVELLGEKHPFFCDPLDIIDIARQIEAAMKSGPQIYNNILTARDRAARILSIISERGI